MKIENYKFFARFFLSFRRKFRLFKKIIRTFFLNNILPGDFYFSHKGYCVCCESEVIFNSYNSWLRDNYLCTKCQCKPRERALMFTLEDNFPNWKEMSIHESSPGKRGGSLKLQKYVEHYIPSQFYPKETFGSFVNGFRNENLEKKLLTMACLT